MTIYFHIDDCKLSHPDIKANDWTNKWLCQEYESIFEDGWGNMSVCQGKVHEYLGMNQDCTVFGYVSIMMFSYLEEILTTFENVDLKGKGKNSSAYPNNLFVINEDCKKLYQ